MTMKRSFSTPYMESAILGLSLWAVLLALICYLANR
jgi:hypothetical protein